MLNKSFCFLILGSIAIASLMILPSCSSASGPIQTTNFDAVSQSTSLSTSPASIASTIQTTAPIERIIVAVPSFKDEVDRIWSTLQQISFFDQYGYKPVFQSFPGIDVLLQKARANQLGDSDYNNLSSEMEKYFNQADYATAKQKVLDSLATVARVFPTYEKFHEEWGFVVFPTYTVQLTFYGMGGSYDPRAGKVILLTNKTGQFSQGESPVKTIIHETVHLGIEEVIVQKYSLGQRTKERLVDLFCQGNFLTIVPDYYMQTTMDTSIDQYLNVPGVWDNLPACIKAFTASPASTATSTVKPSTSTPAKEVEWKYDNGTAVDFQGLFGIYGGHLVKFSSSSINITAIKVYGYCMGDGTNKTFTIKILDPDYHILFTDSPSYSNFGATAGWVTLLVPKVNVTGDFYVVFSAGTTDFNKYGIVIGFDSSANTHSEIVDSGSKIGNWGNQLPPKQSTNWMIRVIGDIPASK